MCIPKACCRDFIPLDTAQMGYSLPTARRARSVLCPVARSGCIYHTCNLAAFFSLIHGRTRTGLLIALIVYINPITVNSTIHSKLVSIASVRHRALFNTFIVIGEYSVSARSSKHWQQIEASDNSMPLARAIVRWTRVLCSRSPPTRLTPHTFTDVYCPQLSRP